MTEREDLQHLERTIELASEALSKGHEPFGSLIVSESGRVLMEAHNEVGGGDATRHPEFAIARWAAENLSEEERASSTVYTSGEHCPMCAAAHGWVGMGRIVYASSASDLASWQREMGVEPGPVRALPIREVAPAIEVEGPFPEFAERVHALHRQMWRR